MNPTKKEKIANYNPSGIATRDSNLFGLPFSAEESEIIIIPVAWEVTTSYRTGTAGAPAAVLEASKQVDLYDSENPTAWQAGFYMLPVAETWVTENERLRPVAEQVIQRLEQNGEPNPEWLKEVNTGSRILNRWIQQQADEWLDKGKIVAVLGGEHSSPFSLVQALAQRNANFGVLQIDAHCDLRAGYEGFEYSHASIMHHFLQYPQVSRLVQCGIRDYAHSEADTIHNSKGRVKLFEMREIRKQFYQGASWHSICKQIVDQLPQNVYISFDIDGLDPSLCPDTGTPVPDGFHFEEIFYLLGWLARSGRKIIGFDLCEVAPGSPVNEWNAIVGARVLYKLCTLTAAANKLV